MDKIKSIFMFVLLLGNTVMAENIGHRLGGDIYKPENTIFSYQKLLKNNREDSKLKYLEFDVRESKDGKLIVFHDSKIERVVPEIKSNLKVLKKYLSKKKFSKIKIEDLNLETIKRLKLAKNSYIPTLKKVLDFSVKSKVKKPIHIEIKRLKSDKARLDLLNLVSKYNQKLDLSFIAFKKHFLRSFPLTQRWIVELQKRNLHFYQIDKHEFTDTIITNTQPYVSLLPETKFTINKENKRELEYKLSIPKEIEAKGKLKIGIYGGADNSGDKGLVYRVKNIKGNTLGMGFSDVKGWKWFDIRTEKDREFILILEDRDTKLKGKYPGNGGIIKVLFQN